MHDVREYNTVSSQEALIRECLHMGWPEEPESGRSTVLQLLSSLGHLPDGHDTKQDLYESLNLIRRHSWSHGSEIWERYLKSRREEALEMASPHKGTIVLQRTVLGGHKPVTRLRVPLPFEHPAQPQLAWRIIATTASVDSMQIGVGHLDLKLRGEPSCASVTIEYDVSLLPQSNRTCLSPSISGLIGTSSPFPTSPVILQHMSDIGSIRDPFYRVRTLWDLFHSELLCGHVHHSQYGQLETERTASSSRWFDCVIAAWNFASLVEKMGIPARVMSGLILNRFGPSPHFWCEVLLNEAWMPIDFYAWDLAKGEDQWRDRLFGSLECRLRFECFPSIFSRFLPMVPWMIERESAQGVAVYTYRRVDDRVALAQDSWRASLIKS